MAKLNGRPVGILGTGVYMPERVLTNEDISRLVETNDEWIVTHTGIRERRIAAEDEMTSDIAAESLRDAVASASISPADLDMIIVGTNSPDTLFPGVGPLVQGKIGATRSGGMDIQAGCTGGVHALAIAAGGIASEIWDRVGVVGAEVLSRLVDWTDRNTCPIFGDGSAACVVGEWKPGMLCVTHATMRADGTKGSLIKLPAGMTGMPASERTVADLEHKIKMQGHEVYKFVNREIPRFMEEFCDECGVAPADIDHWILHQANIRIIEGVMKRMGISMDRAAVNLDRFGNTSTASTFISLHEWVRDGRIRDGEKVLMMSFGAGMTYGAVLMERRMHTER